MTDNTTLSLYQYDACPYCARVRSALDRLNVSIEIRDTLEDPSRLAELIEATGRRTVPVLRIEAVGGEVTWLPESADIVRYLEERFG